MIASEYASIFAALGTRVTMLDAAPRLLAFLDPELVRGFAQAFERMGGLFYGGRRATRVAWNHLDAVEVTLDDGHGARRGRQLLFALGRTANLDGLDIAAAGLAPSARGTITVDGGLLRDPRCPASTRSAMSSARRRSRRPRWSRAGAACHALGIAPGGRGISSRSACTPCGDRVRGARRGRGDREARRRARRSRALRRAWRAAGIAGAEGGMLKLVCDRDGKKLLGVHVVGDGATELVHVGQMAMVGDLDVDVFVEQALNFPTLAEQVPGRRAGRDQSSGGAPRRRRRRPRSDASAMSSGMDVVLAAARGDRDRRGRGHRATGIRRSRSSSTTRSTPARARSSSRRWRWSHARARDRRRQRHVAGRCGARAAAARDEQAARGRRSVEPRDDGLSRRGAASIASVSRLVLTTRRAGDLAATRVAVVGGRVDSIDEVGAAVGTTVEITELFGSVPARLKFLKGEGTEASHVTDLVAKIAMAHPACTCASSTTGAPRSSCLRIAMASPARRRCSARRSRRGWCR